MTPFINRNILFALFLFTAGFAAAQTITSISPNTVPAGSSNFVLTVNGSNFSPDAIVQINGDAHATIPSGSTTLRGLVYAADVAKAGTLTVTVLNDSGTVAHVSNKMTLTVTGSGTPPPPITPPPTPTPTPTPTPPPPTSGKVSITVISPVQNQQVCAPVTIIASAITTNPGAHITRWQLFNKSGVSLWSTSGPVSSIQPRLTLPAGTQTVQINAWDSTGAHAYSNVAFDVTTATPPCGGNATGPVASWKGCMHSTNGQNHQAIDFRLSQGATLPFDATLYWGANCQPNNWADRFGFGQQISFGGFSYIFWFRDFPDQPNMSAIWTVGKQSSGCINYTAVPQC